MAAEQLWASSSFTTTQGLSYTLHSLAQQLPAPRRGQRHCTLVAATISDAVRDPYFSGAQFQVPCFPGDIRGRDQHFLFYEKQLADEICARFPHNVLRSCAKEIARTFTAVIVQSADGIHHCPRRRPKPTTIYYAVIHIPTGDSMEDEDIDVEEFWPGPKPAAVDSVADLVATKLVDKFYKEDRYEDGWSASDCAICTDEIQTRCSSLAMDCSHVFHEDCLLRWLKTSHVCPLCRYQMPTDD